MQHLKASEEEKKKPAFRLKCFIKRSPSSITIAIITHQFTPVAIGSSYM